MDDMHPNEGTAPEPQQDPSAAGAPDTPAPQPAPDTPPAAPETPPADVPPPAGTAAPADVPPTPEPQQPAAQAPLAPEAQQPPTQQPKRSGVPAGCVATLVSLVVAAIVGFVAGIGGATLVTNDRAVDGGGERAIAVVDGETAEPVSAAAAVAVPSVVNIDVTGDVPADPDELPEGHPGVPRSGSGSGVAFMNTPEGTTYLITNDHVVADAEEIIVTDIDGERYDAELVGTDANTDIAVVEIPAELPAIQLGDSGDLVVGELVVAIGSPFGLQQSVTSGVVSALGRSLPNSFSGDFGVYPLVDVIQTDAAINPGNSGGALVDRAGSLIGINTAIYSSTGDNDGIGFAVPVNIAQRVATEIIETGSASAPFLGIVGQTVTEVLAEEEGFAVTEGALVIEIEPETGAAEAGVEADDIIVSFDGEEVRSMDDLILAVRRTVVGDTVAIELYRGDELMEMEIVIGEKPDSL
jgi:putative serine protease PepD